MRGMTALAPFEADVDPRRVPVDVEIVVPVYNEAAQLAERITALRHLPRRVVPLPGPRHGGGQRQHRRHLPRRERVGGHASGRGGDAPARAKDAATPCARRGRPVRPPSSPTWTSTSPPPCRRCSRSWRRCCRATATWPSGRAWPVGRTSCAAPSESSSRGPTTCCSNSPCGAASATPSAGSRLSDGTRRRSCCPSSRTTSGSSIPSCWSPPSGWACASARSRWTGSTIPTRGSTSSRPPPTTCAACGGCSCGAPRACAAWRSNEVAADQLLRFAGVGVISTLGYLFLFVAWRPLLGPISANAVAMAIATLFNTAVHRELSRTTDGQARRGRLYAVAGGLYVVSLALHDAGPPRRPAGGPRGPAPGVGGDHRGQPGRRRLPLRRAAGLDLPPRRPHGHRLHGDVTDDGPHARPAMPPSGCSTRRSTSTPRADDRRAPTPRRRRRPGRPAPGAGRVARFVRGKESDAPWVRPALAHAARRHRRPLPVGPRGERVGQLLLLGGGAGGDQELEGVLLRLLGLVQLHHRRQAARVLVADGDLGPHLRAQLVEHAGAAGPRGCRDRRPGLPVRPALVQRAGRDPRWCRRGTHARWPP